MVQKRVLRAFNAGEISPDLFGRDDIAKVNSGCVALDNWILTIQGAAYFRGGMLYSHQTKNNTKTLSMDFCYNDADCYTMEFGEKYVRFYRNQKLMVNAQGEPIELTTPYKLADLFDEKGVPLLTKAQSGDVIYLFQKQSKYPMQRLERNANGSFSFAEVDFEEAGGFEDLNKNESVRVYASAQTGDSVTITANAAIFKQGHVGGLFYAEPINFNGIYKWSEGRDVSANQRIISDYKTYIATGAGTSGYATPTHTEGTATDGKITWKYEDCGYGIGRILTVAADGKSCTVKVLLPFPFAVVGQDRKTWKYKFGSWCAEYGYPTCGCFHRERLCLARGSRLWFSWSDDFEDFSEKDYGKITYETGFSFNVSSGVTVGSIQWLESSKDLICGTDVNVVAVAESNTSDLFYVSNCRSYEQTRDACRQIQPVRVGQRFVFTDISGQSANVLIYDSAKLQYDPDTLQNFAKHICVEGIVDMVHIKEPFDVIYCLKANGALSCCLYSPSQEGLAWYRLKTDGFIESISKDGNNLALCVRRTKIVDGEKVNNYGIEFLQNPFQGYFSKTLADFATEKEYKQYCIDSLLETQKEACYLDGAIIKSSDTEFSTVDFGIEHLAGRTVRIVSEGGIEPDQEVKLVNGKWTVTLTYPSKIAIIGLPYIGVIIPTPMEGDGERSARGRKKRVNGIGFRVYNSMGGQYGRTMDTLVDALSRTGADNLNNPIPLYSGDIETRVFNGEYQDAERVIFVQPYPLPFTLQAIVLDYEIY